MNAIVMDKFPYSKEYSSKNSRTCCLDYDLFTSVLKQLLPLCADRYTTNYNK